MIVKLTSYETRKAQVEGDALRRDGKPYEAQSGASTQGPHHRRHNIDVDDRRENRVFALQRPQGDRPD